MFLFFVFGDLKNCIKFSLLFFYLIFWFFFIFVFIFYLFIHFCFHFFYFLLLISYFIFLVKYIKAKRPWAGQDFYLIFSFFFSSGTTKEAHNTNDPNIFNLYVFVYFIWYFMLHLLISVFLYYVYFLLLYYFIYSFVLFYISYLVLLKVVAAWLTLTSSLRGSVICRPPRECRDSTRNAHALEGWRHSLKGRVRRGDRRSFKRTLKKVDSGSGDEIIVIKEAGRPLKFIVESVVVLSNIQRSLDFGLSSWFFICILVQFQRSIVFWSIT